MWQEICWCLLLLLTCFLLHQSSLLSHCENKHSSYQKGWWQAKLFFDCYSVNHQCDHCHGGCMPSGQCVGLQSQSSQFQTLLSDHKLELEPGTPLNCTCNWHDVSKDYDLWWHAGLTSFSVLDQKLRIVTIISSERQWLNKLYKKRFCQWSVILILIINNYSLFINGLLTSLPSQQDGFYWQFHLACLYGTWPVIQQWKQN